MEHNGRWMNGEWHEPTYVFDGFCQRPYDESMDGWLKTQETGSNNPAVVLAEEILNMNHEINSLRRENWGLKKIEERYNKLISRGGF